MSWKKSYRDRYDYAFAPESDFSDKPPSAKDKTDVARYVTQLWDDGKKYLQESFSATKDGVQTTYATPQEFWEACAKLEEGRHFEVYPSRKSAPTDKWKQELVDNEIQKQIRAKKNHITANWHEIVISPNIAGINEIFDQERKATGWTEHVREWVSYAQNFGGVWVRSILDKTENPLGVATEMTCRIGSVMRTPGAKSIKKIDGCWYAIHGERVNDAWVRKHYPKIDLSTSQGGDVPSFLELDKKVTNYTHTKQFNKLEVFLDDDSTVDIPFDPQEFDARIGNLMAVVQLSNEDPQAAQNEEETILPKDTDNHKKWIKAYTDWIEEKIDFYKRIEASGTLLGEDADLIEKTISVVDKQLAMHEELLAKSQELDPSVRVPPGKQRKYPKGRYIVTIDGVLAEDTENPYQNEWRHLFHELKNEKVPEREDGRGDVEILLEDNRTLDLFLSRMADDALLATHKKPWFPRSEKKFHDTEGLSSDPTEPGYSESGAPEFASGTANNQYLQMYNIVKGGLKETLGINQTTRGESNFSGESGKHAEALISQNVTMVAGELNMNLNDLLEDIVETRIEMWKVFYTEPRPYFIEGQLQMIVVADLLKDVETIQVDVKPESNFPNRDEAEINMLVSLAKVLDATGQPIIPPDMILDYVSRRFPSLGPGGKYRKTNQLVALGKQVLAQQKAAKAERQRAAIAQGDALDETKRKVQAKMTSAAADKIMAHRQMLVPSNGNGMGAQM